MIQAKVMRCVMMVGTCGNKLIVTVRSWLRQNQLTGKRRIKSHLEYTWESHKYIKYLINIINIISFKYIMFPDVFPGVETYLGT